MCDAKTADFFSQDQAGSLNGLAFGSRHCRCTRAVQAIPDNEVVNITHSHASA
jgi:hypothetical protein